MDGLHKGGQGPISGCYAIEEEKEEEEEEEEDNLTLHRPVKCQHESI
jgi:hypothetical protein